MVKFINKILPIALIIFSVTLVGCTQNSNSTEENTKLTSSTVKPEKEMFISIPDKIIIYSKDKAFEILSTDKNFDKIVKLTNERIDKNKISTVKDDIDNDYVALQKKENLSMEFIYNSEQKLELKGDGFIPINYKKLYFLLKDNTGNTEQGSLVNIFQYSINDKYQSSSRGPLKYSSELVEIAQNYVK